MISVKLLLLLYLFNLLMLEFVRIILWKIKSTVSVPAFFINLWDSCFCLAFDQIDDKMKALEDVIELGFKRILTSGGSDAAETGVDTLKNLVLKVILCIDFANIYLSLELYHFKTLFFLFFF